MNEQSPIEVETIEGVFEFVKSRVDDIEKVIIGAPGAPLPGTLIFGDFTMMIHLVNGNAKLVFRSVAERLLNDGILSRLRIPIEFMPMER